MLALILLSLIGTAPAKITTQPASQTVMVGSVAKFCVIANGSNISYAWYLNSVAIGGATTSCYITPATTLAQSGETFYVTLSNKGGTVKSNVVSLTVESGSTGTIPAITSVATATGTVGTTFTFTVTATGSPAPAITESGALPAGIRWSSPTLSGTPTAAGVTDLAFTATNSAGSAGQSFALTINAAPPVNTLSMTSPFSMPQAIVGQAYSASIATAASVQLNGAACTACTYAGTIASPMAISSAGLITGTPKAAGTLSFTVTVTSPTGSKMKIKMKMRAHQ